MIIEQVWTNNAYRNFNYLLVCPETGEAATVDPLDHNQCLKIAKLNGWEITKIINTHEHQDHTGGNKYVVDKTGAKILAHAGSKDKIDNINIGLNAGDIIKIGKTVEIEVLDTPGHTMSHICLLSHTEQRSLISGDTLFNAGAGNCHNGGHPAELYKTFVDQLSTLPDNTKILPGHDYIINNLEFTLSREPSNKAASDLLTKLKCHDPKKALITTIGIEKEVNTFFRLTNQIVIDQLRESFPELPINPSPKTVFLKLRELRNNW